MALVGLRHCFLILLTIISRQRTDSTRTKRGVSGCNVGFVQLGFRCYKFPNQLQATYQQAQDLCSTLNSSLANVNTETDYDKIVKYISRNGYHDQRYWIKFEENEATHDNIDGTESDGMEASSMRSCTAIALYPSYLVKILPCNHRNLFVCQHNIEITRISERMTDDEFSCVTKHGYFPYSNDCTRYILCFNGRKFIYRCSKNAVYVKELQSCSKEAHCSTTNSQAEHQTSVNNNNGNSTKDITAESDNYSCHEGFVKHGITCYKIYQAYVGWNTANQTCVEADNARLLKVTNHDTMTFIKKLIKQGSCSRRNCRKKINDYWIGLNDIAEADRYMWSDGTNLTLSDYHNWSKRARRRHKMFKECVKLSTIYKFKWLDAVCNEEYGYICEKDAIKLFKPKNANCGQYHRPGVPRVQEIIGGTVAEGRSHPWLASLQFNNEHKCGGSLIDHCWIMTAAHCVSLPHVPRDKIPTTAVLGDYNRREFENTEERLSVAEIFVHPLWNAFPVPTNDIALIRLQRCSQQHNPICLPARDEPEFSTGTECCVAGYGTVNPNSKAYPDTLMEATVPLLDFETCQSLYLKPPKRLRLTYISESMICAGFLEGGVDSCQGDSGGPLTCHRQSSNQETQWGIVSWGNGCAERNKPGIYTKVKLFVDWIRNTTSIDF